MVTHRTRTLILIGFPNAAIPLSRAREATGSEMHAGFIGIVADAPGGPGDPHLESVTESLRGIIRAIRVRFYAKTELSRA